MEESEFPPPTPKDLADASPQELASFALRKDLALLCDSLRDAIDDGLDPGALHNIVGLWEANHSDLTFEDLVEWGRPCACDDCRTDVTPYDEDGRLIEGGSEWYAVADEVWQVATDRDGSIQYLCIGCLEKRVGRPLKPSDLPDLGVNEPSWLNTPRLNALLADESHAKRGATDFSARFRCLRKRPWNKRSASY